ncbi:hypothetical protein F6X51_03745 [Methylobacterium planeticum]|uniref:Uncharacterized protein n=1 Tax=Methylobacterium planeticum TaxID=2615211 RepID=A0A6N6MWK8_9HYPH|nr:hypothetical protein F6X51_03745 [Methylobacterium planeticum]
MRLGGLVALGVLAASGPRAEEGNFLSNIFKYGGTTVPPSQAPELEAPYCPPVGVTEGGAALQAMGGSAGNAASIRTQMSLGRLARECVRRQDGSISVKVGVEGRVLLGPAGAPGRFDVPLTIVIKYDDKVVTSRSHRTSVTVAPGEAQGFFSVIEEDLVVPAAMTRDYEIEVGLGGGAKAKKAPARRKPVPAASAGGEPGAAQ